MSSRRLDFEARSEPLNVHVVKVLEEARTNLAEGGAKLEYKFHRYNAGKQLENPRVEFQISSVASPGPASSVYVIEIVRSGELTVRTKQSFGDPDSTLTPHGTTPRTAASLKDVGLTDVIKAAIDEYVQQGAEQRRRVVTARCAGISASASFSLTHLYIGAIA